MEARRKGIGGSDIAAICGLSPWKTSLQVFLDKTSPTPTAFEESERMKMGKVMEPVIADLFKETSGLYVERCNAQLQHPSNPIFMANIDRACIKTGLPRNRKTGEFNLEAEILECKNVGEWAFRRMFNEAEESIPLHYRCQVQWYLGVTGLQSGYLAALVDGWHFVQFHVERDANDIAAMQEIGAKFWQDHVLKGIPPPPENAADVLRLFPRSAPKSILASGEIETALKRLAEVKAQLKEMEGKKESLEDSIKAYFGEHDTLKTLDGVTLATWKSNTDSKKTNWENVAGKLGYLLTLPKFGGINPKTLKAIAKFNTKTTPGARVLRLKAGKAE